MKKMLLLFGCLAVFSSSVYAGSFTRQIQDVQVLEDRVRIYVGTTYGTCGSREGWWGWPLSHAAHSAWLSVVLTAVSQSEPVTIYDSQDSCAGGTDYSALEGIFLSPN